MNSGKSIVFVNPEDQIIAIVESPQVKENTVIKQHSQKIRYQQNMNNQLTERLIKTSRWHRCLRCLSRHVCLIIVIFLILCLIGLAGVGVSTYFLVIDTKDNFLPTVIGIAIGGVLTVAALGFIYCLLGYISYRDRGRAFASSKRYKNTKDITIEMPERLLTGKKMSPKTYENRLNKVVNNIGHIVEDAKKRYPDEIPTKVIINVDPNINSTI